MDINAIVDQLKFDDKGLLSTIVQDAENNEILMFAFMNAESFKISLESGYATYWSRSRQKLWKKGESSGHRQKIKQLFFDCDADCLLIKVEQEEAACHKGYRSCFYNEITDAGLKISGEKIFDENEVYKK